MPDAPQIDPHRPDRQNWNPISPTDAELDVIDAFAGACRVTPIITPIDSEAYDGSVVLVSDLTAEIRRHRAAARAIRGTPRAAEVDLDWVARGRPVGPDGERA